MHANGTNFSWTTDLLPPSTEVESKPLVLTTVSTAEFSFGCSDGEGKCTFRYLLDSALQWQTFGLGAFVGAVQEAVTTAVAVTRVIEEQEGVQVSASQRMVFQLSVSVLTAVQFQYRLLLEGQNNASIWMSLPVGKAFAALSGLPNGNHTLEVSVLFAAFLLYLTCSLFVLPDSSGGQQHLLPAAPHHCRALPGGHCGTQGH